LPETDDANAPAFSPDGRAVASDPDRAIKILPLDGGLARDVARLERGQVYWTWSDPDHIVVTGPAGLLRVPVNGGTPEPIVKLATGEALFGSASALPSGAHLVSRCARRQLPTMCHVLRW
jgi:hypothetical protein